MTARIEWRPRMSPYGRGVIGLNGFVGDVRCFSVGWQKLDTYYVETTLPGFKIGITREGEAEAQALCERMLARFLERIGARP